MLKKVAVLFSFALLSISSFGKSVEPEKPDTVNIGVFINSLYDFNLSAGEFTTTLWLWMTYDNDSLEIYDYLEFPNAKEVEEFSKEVEKVEGKNWVSANYKLLINQSYNTNQFPYDVQTLSFRVEDNMYDTRKVVFKPDVKNSKLSNLLEFEDWEVEKFEIVPVTSTYESTYGDPSLDGGSSEYSAVDVNVVIKRKQPGLFWKYFSVVFIAFGFIFISLLLPISNIDARVSLSIGGIFATVGNKYIVDSKLPESSAFSLADQIHIFTFIAIFVALMVSAISFVLKSTGHETKATLFNRLFIVILPLIYIYLIYSAI